MATLDISTQLLNLTLIRLGQSLAFFILWRIRPDYIPARDWTIGAGLAGLGLLAPIALPTSDTPLLLSIVIFNGLTLSGWLLFNAGVIRAAGHRVPWTAGFVLVAGAVLGIAVLANLTPEALGWRIAIYHTCTILADLYTAKCALSSAKGSRSLSLKLIAVALGLLIISSLVRVILSFGPDVTSGLDPSFNAPFLFFSTPLLVIAALLLSVQAAEDAQRELENQARRDALTQALNRRGFDELASREWARSKRNGSSIGVLTLDIDHFKAVNDNHGHQIGDHVLQSVAARIQSVLRPEDLFGRMGGDEFLVMLPGSSLEQTTLVAERIRTAIADLVITQDVSIVNIGVSIGIASVQASTQGLEHSWDAALRSADLALYQAKKAGRNRVVVGAG